MRGRHWTVPPCRHAHKAEAVALVYLPQGCPCFPHERRQWLCEQHLVKLDVPYQVIRYVRTRWRHGRRRKWR